jgi:hypothetical protein
LFFQLPHTAAISAYFKMNISKSIKLFSPTKNASHCALAVIAAPADDRRLTSVASWAATHPYTPEPIAVATPRTAMLSLIAMIVSLSVPASHGR